MRKRLTTTTTKRKSSAAAAALLTSSPPPLTPTPAAAAASPSLSSPSQSPPLPEFDFHFNDDATLISKKKMNNSNKNNGGGSKLMMMQLQLQPNSSPQKHQQQRQSLNTISDLKDMASSDLESLKRHLDRSHSEILKDLEASRSRLHKRFKMQSQTCQQLMDEAEKEYKKISEQTSEGREAMKASYAEFMAEVHASASRICKTSIPELSQTMEKGIALLRSRYGISSTAT